MSIGLAVALVGLTALALAMLLVPLILRRRGPASRDAYNLAVYRDQLAEIERDLARGVLAGSEAEAARAEIARRILALKPAEAETGAGANPRAVAIVAILLLPVAAWTLYWQLGSPALPDQPFAERAAAGTPPSAANPAHIDMDEAVARLGAHLKEHPEDLTGWLLLARTELGLGRYRRRPRPIAMPPICRDIGPTSRAIGARRRCWRPAARSRRRRRRRSRPA